MAVVRCLEGTFYDVPDNELERYKVPADQVNGLMESAGRKAPSIFGQQPAGQSQPTGGTLHILVQFIIGGSGTPQQGQTQATPAEGEEKVEPQWYWINCSNWYNWY